ncbi:MAG: hypothetical protein E7182_02310 [Erysipelotrichaceae bacterium]|nr:hypothetical protein [Erysipelotrichaceae bacterium]
MRNKLRILSLGLLLSGVFGLAACDTVEAKLPEAEQSQQILVIDQKDNIPHNEIEELFEKVVPGDSSTASKVLDSLLLRLAKSHFGVFYDTLDESGNVTEKGLRSIVQSDDDIRAFVSSHAKFQILKDDGSHDEEAEIQGVKDFYEHLMQSIRDSFWSDVKNTSYQDHYLFSEKKFYDTQKAALYRLDDEYGESLDVLDNLTPLDGTLDSDSVAEFFGDDTHDFMDIYKDYIERSLIPDLYRKVIVENYVQRNNYSAIGHKHNARKVQTITLKNLDESTDATRNLVTHYARYILEGGIVEAEDRPSLVTTDSDIEALLDLKFLSRLYDGLIDVDAETIEGQVAKYLYAKADWASDTIVIDGNTRTYYPLTTLGKIYKDYKEISNVRWETGSGTDFTGSGAYTKETGLMYKEREIFSKNSATDGWFTKSGLSELPSSVHDNLFKIKVANEVDSNYTIDEQGNVTIDEDKDFGDKGFGRYINGHYYLTADKVSKSDAFPYLIFDSDSSSWVIVRVDEAVKASKIVQDADSKTSYNYLESLGLREGKENQNEIVWRITGLISGSDDYSKAARQEIIENANIVYHDQNVYDYFSTNFPDLFD